VGFASLPAGKVLSPAGFAAYLSSRRSAVPSARRSAFQRAAKGTQAKFLLTSRRDERGWLGDLPTRIEVPPMPL